MEGKRLVCFAAICLLAILGCSIASATTLNGVDVSSYDGTFDWNALKAATSFAIIRSSCGVGYRDPNLSYNQPQARSVSILRGYYHYCYPDLGNSATAEADYMLGQIGALQPGEVLCLDYERPNYGSCVSWCKAFLDRVYAQTGIKPFIYMNKSTLDSYNWSSVRDAGYPLWLAFWDGISDPTTPTTSWGFTTMKQWNGEQSIDVGPLTNADVDVFNGNANDFQSHGLSGWQQDTTPPTVPTNLSASAVSATQVNLSWTASTDNYGVAGYKIYRNGAQIDTTSSTTYSDTTCAGCTTYSYTVSAYDTSYNNSAQSSPASVTTPQQTEWTTNGSFETGTTSGWTAYSRTSTPALSIQSTGVLCGTKYLYEQLTSLNTAGGVYQVVSGLTNGATYTISGARKSVHTDITVSVKVDTNGGTSYASAEQTIASGVTSGWQTFSSQVTATGTSMTIFLDSSQSGGVSSSHVGAFDCISLSSTQSCGCNPGTPPTSVSASPAAICSGSSTTLAATGGSGTTCAWYTGSCGGTLAGTGTSLVVSPSVTTTYYVRWETSCGNSTCASVTVTVNARPSAPTGPAANPSTISSGQSSTLSASVAAGCTVDWYTGSCGGTLVGSGTSLVVTPAATTTYYPRARNTSTGCVSSSCGTAVTVTVNAPPVTVLNAGFETWSGSVTADNWTQYNKAGTVTCQKGSTFTGTPAVSAHGGTGFQRVKLAGSGYQGGVYQRFASTPGVQYTVTAYLLSRITSTSQAEAKLGVDPSGATVPGASTVWSSTVTGDSAWTAKTATVTATGSYVTIFLNGRHPTTDANQCNVFFDDVSVQ